MLQHDGQAVALVAAVSPQSLASRAGGVFLHRLCRRMVPAASELLVSLGALASVLTVVFAALKMAGVLAWPWVWVLSPMEGMFAGVLLFSLAFGMTVMAQGATSGARRHPHRR
jgi:hypothetical protein